VILDMVAGDVRRAARSQCLAEDGRIVIIAVQGGTRAGFDAGLVLRKRLIITGLHPAPTACGLQGAAIAAALARTGVAAACEPAQYQAR
jgi:NADPH2:quinone reductase